MALAEYYGTGRRKTSTVRVHLRQGSGEITVNHRGRDIYAPNELLKRVIKQPLSPPQTAAHVDIRATVAGRGPSGPP